MPRRTPLVCQHLENISRQALEKYQHIIKQYVRYRHGVYALYRRDKLYYVGLASNLRIRLGHHLKDRHGQSWDRFSVYLTIGDSHLREIESLLLRIVKTKGNKQKGRLPKSEDLRRKFSHDIKRSWMAEIHELLGTKTPHTANIKRPVKITGRQPVLSQYPNGPKILRVRYKGKIIYAKVRKTGLIWTGGKLFTSPSLAGQHVIERPTCNGWTFWQYQRAPGDWVLLDELRK
jgi:Restriction Enzyme Adenine Methylase Associated